MSPGSQPCHSTAPQRLNRRTAKSQSPGSTDEDIHSNPSPCVCSFKNSRPPGTQTQTCLSFFPPETRQRPGQSCCFQNQLRCPGRPSTTAGAGGPTGRASRGGSARCVRLARAPSRPTKPLHAWERSPGFSPPFYVRGLVSARWREFELCGPEKLHASRCFCYFSTVRAPGLYPVRRFKPKRLPSRRKGANSSSGTGSQHGRTLTLLLPS